MSANVFALEQVLILPSYARRGRTTTTSPALVQQNFRIIKEVQESGVAVLMVEQNANIALSIADRGYVLATGEIVLHGPASELLHHEDLKRAYLGR